MIFFNYLFRSKKHIQELTWPEVHSLYHESHENVLAVIDLIVTLPTSSSGNEGGFSQMKLTKTSIRSRLSNANLNNSMAIQMLTPGVKEFDPDQAINKWTMGGKRERRPIFNEGSSRKRARLESNVNLLDLGSVEVVKHTAAILEPAAQQNIPVEQDEEAEEEVIFSEKRDDDFGDDDEGVVSD